MYIMKIFLFIYLILKYLILVKTLYLVFCDKNIRQLVRLMKYINGDCMVFRRLFNEMMLLMFSLCVSGRLEDFLRDRLAEDMYMLLSKTQYLVVELSFCWFFVIYQRLFYRVLVSLIF